MAPSIFARIKDQDEAQQAPPPTLAPSVFAGMDESPMGKMVAAQPEPAPVFAPSAAPRVALAPQPITPEQQNISSDQQRLEKVRWNQDNPWGTANNHPGVMGKVAHAFSTLGNIAGDIFAPAVTANIPGSQLNMQEKEAGLTKRLNEETVQQSGIETAKRQGDLHEQQARAAELTPASQEEADKYSIPIGTPLNAATRAALAKQTGINQTKLTAERETNQTRSDIAAQNAQLRQSLAALKPEQRDDRAIRLMQKQDQDQPLTQEENAYLKSYAKWVDQTKTQPGVARAAAYAQFKPVQVLGENGDVHYDSAMNAIHSGASTPSSMNFRTASGMAKFMTSGKGGQTITAYNTANDHLDLLGKAMDALDNGDVQGLNQLSNRFKQEFGQAAPTNVNAIKAMLAGELANVAKVTGATDQEIKEQKDNINRSASPEQIRGFIETNHDLMDQKAYEMYQQYQQGMQGKPAFSTGLTGRTPLNQGAGAPPPGAKIIKWEDVK